MFSNCQENGEQVFKSYLSDVPNLHMIAFPKQFRLFCKLCVQSPCETQQIHNSPDNSESRDPRVKRLPQTAVAMQMPPGQYRTPGRNASWAVLPLGAAPAHPPTARTPTANASRAVSDTHARMPLGQYCRHVRTNCAATFNVNPPANASRAASGTWARMPLGQYCRDEPRPAPPQSTKRTACKCLPGSIGSPCPNASWAVLLPCAKPCTTTPTTRTPRASASRAVSGHHARMPLGQYCYHVQSPAPPGPTHNIPHECLLGSIGPPCPNASWGQGHGTLVHN